MAFIKIKLFLRRLPTNLTKNQLQIAVTSATQFKAGADFSLKNECEATSVSQMVTTFY